MQTRKSTQTENSQTFKLEISGSPATVSVLTEEEKGRKRIISVYIEQCQNLKNLTLFSDAAIQLFFITALKLLQNCIIELHDEQQLIAQSRIILLGTMTLAFTYLTETPKDREVSCLLKSIFQQETLYPRSLAQIGFNPNSHQQSSDHLGKTITEIGKKILIDGTLPMIDERIINIKFTPTVFGYSHKEAHLFRSALRLLIQDISNSMTLRAKL